MRLETSNPILRILTNTVLLERKNKNRKSKSDTLGIIEIKTFCSSKDTSRKMKRQTTY